MLRSRVTIWNQVARGRSQSANQPHHQLRPSSIPATPKPAMAKALTISQRRWLCTISAEDGQDGRSTLGAGLQLVLHQAEALLEPGLAGQVAQHLAAERGPRDRKGRLEAEIGVLRLLGEHVVLQMVFAVASDAAAAQPLADPLVDPRIAVQGAVSGVVLQDAQAQLPRADDHHRHGIALPPARSAPSAWPP